MANTIINKKIDTVSSTPSTLVKQIIATKTVADIDEKELEQIIQQVVSESQNAVKDYKKGKVQVLGFLMGMTNRKLAGKKIDTLRIKQLLEKLLNQ